MDGLAPPDGSVAEEVRVSIMACTYSKDIRGSLAYSNILAYVIGCFDLIGRACVSCARPAETLGRPVSSHMQMHTRHACQYV
jgi:hypothetical protein